MEVQKVQCPNCGSWVWDYFIISYTINGETHFICPNCPENNN